MTHRDFNKGPDDRTQPKESYLVKPNNSGLADGIDHRHLNRLVDEMAIQDYLEKSSES